MQKEPTLESLHNKLLLTMCADKRQLSSLEDEMLHMVQSISGELMWEKMTQISFNYDVGNILDDEELICALQGVKQVAMGAKERIEDAQESQKMVDSHRQYLQPVCFYLSECVCVHRKEILFVSFHFRLQPGVPLYTFLCYH